MFVQTECGGCTKRQFYNGKYVWKFCSKLHWI